MGRLDVFLFRGIGGSLFLISAKKSAQLCEVNIASILIIIADNVKEKELAKLLGLEVESRSILASELLSGVNSQD